MVAGDGRSSLAGIEAVGAEPSDLDTVLSVLEEAAGWLASRGIDQWRPGSFSRDRIMNRIERGEVYLAVLDGRPVGNVVLQWSDGETWGDVPDDAGYVHGLAIRREMAGRGLGRELLRWAGDRAAGAGKKFLRLDCAAENRALTGYYERAGFVFRGRVHAWGFEVSLYERRSARRDRDEPFTRGADPVSVGRPDRPGPLLEGALTEESASCLRGRDPVDGFRVPAGG